jgi:YjbE family integral membrane protein
MGVMGFLAGIDWAAVVEIVAIDVLLGGDNAIIIALACRSLAPEQRKVGIFWGTVGAILLRVILITVAVALLEVPWLRIVGGALLLWIGIKLISPPTHASHKDIPASQSIWGAVKTIIVADFVMSLDNVIAIAGAAEDAAESQRLGLVIFGLLMSVPIIIFGSQIVLTLFDRFPIIVTLGGALLGWIAGGLFANDVALHDWITPTRTMHYASSAAGAVLVVAVAKLIQLRRGEPPPATR